MNAQRLIIPGLAIVAGFFLGRGCSRSRTEVIEVTSTDTVTVKRIDSVVVERPTPVKLVEKSTYTLTVYRGTDTLYVPVPIRQYSFRDSLYSLDVSGFNVTLDRLEVYPKTVYRTVTNTSERVVTDRKRWGLGIQAGYGYNFGSGKPGPYIGIGVQYSLWRW